MSATGAPDGLLRVDPPGLAKAVGYSHGVLAPAGARHLFLAGQIGWDADERLVGSGFAEQFEQALANLVAVVREAGGAPDGLAQLTVFVTDKQEYLESRKELGAIWKRHVGRTWPAMALVEVAALLEDGAKVEIQGTAIVGPTEDDV